VEAEKNINIAAVNKLTDEDMLNVDMSFFDNKKCSDLVTIPSIRSRNSLLRWKRYVENWSCGS
jgi:hypothetical protein